MLVDAHAHVWRAVPNYPEPAVTTMSPVSDVSAEVLDEYLAEHGIDRAVLVQPVYPGEDNGYVADCAARRPDLVRGRLRGGPAHARGRRPAGGLGAAARLQGPAPAAADRRRGRLLRRPVHLPPVAAGPGAGRCHHRHGRAGKSTGPGRVTGALPDRQGRRGPHGLAGRVRGRYLPRLRSAAWAGALPRSVHQGERPGLFFTPAVPTPTATAWSGRCTTASARPGSSGGATSLTSC
jgi:hypothetical protein